MRYMDLQTFKGKMAQQTYIKLLYSVIYIQLALLKIA